MRPAPAACVAFGLALFAAAPLQVTPVTLAYRTASEDDSPAGRMRLELTAGRLSRAVVWEHACSVSARRDAEEPGSDADQFWTFRLELTKDAKGRPAVRVRHRVVKPSGLAPEQDRLLVLDGKDTLVVDAFSARTDCRYDRVHLTVSGG